MNGNVGYANECFPVSLKGKAEYDHYLKERPEAGDVVVIDEEHAKSSKDG